MTSLATWARRPDFPARRLAVSALLLPLIPLASLYAGTPFVPALMGTLALGVAMVLGTAMSSGLRDYVMATALMGQAMMMTAVFTGHPFQIDTHMLFFVLLAVIAIPGRIDVLIYACAITALHHLLLTVALPALVYPTAELTTNIARTALHGGIVVLEGVVLGLAARDRNASLAQIRRKSRELEIGTQMAEDARLEVQAAHQAASRVIEEMRIALSRLAGRDLCFGIQGPFPAQYEVLRSEFNMTVGTLREAFASASDVVGGFSTDSQSLSHTMNDLAALSEVQSRALAEMTAATETLVDVLSRTAEQARDAARSSGEARDSAVNGSEVTTAAIAAMRAIEEGSRQIESIVDLIDDVSFQTNLLALNAGVEAARAGEAGKGFAVVAAEVRQLAKSTSEAASGIRQLIHDSTRQVSSGAELVDAVGQRLQEIKDQISRASDLTASISNRNAEQAGALSQLHEMVRSTNDRTRQAAVMGERLAGMSRRMTVSSRKLSCDMEAFTFSEDDLNDPDDRASPDRTGPAP
ncbi:methyl-accepting chemotaxis protein [Sagittula sp.]|uniref:methyl-accepting chemotaxis protein n=1 Tax=Sagittula sp. TaxID=2038081 RepID=UPI003518C61B